MDRNYLLCRVDQARRPRPAVGRSTRPPIQGLAGQQAKVQPGFGTRIISSADAESRRPRSYGGSDLHVRRFRGELSTAHESTGTGLRITSSADGGKAGGRSQRRTNLHLHRFRGKLDAHAKATGLGILITSSAYCSKLAAAVSRAGRSTRPPRPRTAANHRRHHRLHPWRPRTTPSACTTWAMAPSCCWTARTTPPTASWCSRSRRAALACGRLGGQAKCRKTIAAERREICRAGLAAGAPATPLQ